MPLPPPSGPCWPSPFAYGHWVNFWSATLTADEYIGCSTWSKLNPDDVNHVIAGDARARRRR